MWDEDELDDDDLRSVYGEAALRARYRRTVEHYERKYAETTAHLDTISQRLATLQTPPQSLP